MLKIYTKDQAAAGGWGPGRAAAAWPPPGILYISCIPCNYIFVDICIYILTYLEILGVVVVGVVQKFKKYYSKNYLLDLVDQCVTQIDSVQNVPRLIQIDHNICCAG